MKSMPMIFLGTWAVMAVAAGGCGNRATDEVGADTPAVAVSGDGAADWCAEHAIAESACPFCNPGLVEEMGWCAGHDVAEALCWICNPAVIPAYEAVGDWCAGHGLPESRCLECNPHLVDANAEVPASAGEPSDTGPRYRRAPSVTCTTQFLTLNFERETIAEEVGLEHTEVAVRSVSRLVECNAVLDYDGNRLARLTPPVGGLIRSVTRDLGDRLEPGDLLAVIVSPAFGAAKAAYLQALASEALWARNHEREKDLLARGAATERDLLAAETNLAESRIARSRAEQELAGLGLSAARIAEVARSGETSNEYPVTTPIAGIVVERNAVVGDFASAASPLFAVADVTRMWARLDVYEADFRDVAVGQSLVLHLAGRPGDPVGATVTRVAAHLDPRTRTLQARAELVNPDGALRANMFARAVVTVREARPTVVVPRAAVQWEGCCNVVFVRESATTYRPTKVHLGPAAGALVEVRHGLQGGETVVTQGSFLLKTEILKGSIGAGCCEVQPGT
ncbi:MAG: efflux RND transporter periplasmic adaptor subunit [bacterium]|nr:efflux RND transporter periplasmic adaptor subunit [bacterium]